MRSGCRKIFIVDDHAMVRAGIVRLLQPEKDLAVCGEAPTVEEALERLEKATPDVVLIDLSLNGSNGLELISALRRKSSTLRLLVLSMHPETLYAERCLTAGANGYVMKKESADTLVRAIRTVLAGKTYLSSEANDVIIDRLTHPNAHAQDDPAKVLTERELETFRLIGQGYGTRQISEVLHISMKTVEAHRGHIRAKYRMTSNYQLVQKAIKWVHQEMPPA